MSTTTTKKYSELNSLLNELEEALKRHPIWPIEKPSVQALNSHVPFAADTMSLEQWLMYIFIPRLRYLSVNKLPLPNTCSVEPIAQEVLGQGYETIINTICKLDGFLSA